jgi:hypothetical protein
MNRGQPVHQSELVLVRADLALAGRGSLDAGSRPVAVHRTWAKRSKVAGLGGPDDR